MYTAEQVLGNQFVVQCKVGIAHCSIDHIDDTIDYALILSIIQSRFATPTPLLETLANRIEEDIRLQFPHILYLYLSIQKKRPMLAAIVASSEVILEKKYSENK